MIPTPTPNPYRYSNEGYGNYFGGSNSNAISNNSNPFRGVFLNGNGQFNLGNIGGLAGIGFGLADTLMQWKNLKQQGDQFNKQFNFNKQAYQKNLDNQTKSYNLGLEDRAANRNMYTNGAYDQQGYIDRNRLYS